MTTLNIAKTTTTDLDNTLDNFTVDRDALDFAGDQEETTWDFNEAAQNFGYYKTIPELGNAIDSLALWTAGKGYTSESSRTEVILEGIIGWGEDSFQSIMQNMITVKKIVGDAFAEIIRGDDKTLINLKPISPERMRIVVDKKGMIKRYDERLSNGKFKPHKRENILHLCNKRLADEIHGNSVIERCKWVIDARNEAMTDYRKVLHRNVIPVRIIEVETDDSTKRDALIAEYEEAIKKGEVLVVPKGTVEIKDNTITIQDPTTWISYLENFFYQAVGVPRIIATSEGFTEAGGKVGFLTFEPVYTNEQTLLEQDLWSQLAINITFKRPPSLQNNVAEDEEKNTGQTGFQPKESEINMERE